VDRVVEVEPQKYAIGYKNITVNDQFFNGHFPERAIMPGGWAGWLAAAAGWVGFGRGERLQQLCGRLDC